MRDSKQLHALDQRVQRSLDCPPEPDSHLPQAEGRREILGAGLEAQAISNILTGASQLALP